MSTSLVPEQEKEKGKEKKGARAGGNQDGARILRQQGRPPEEGRNLFQKKDLRYHRSK